MATSSLSGYGINRKVPTSWLVPGWLSQGALNLTTWWTTECIWGSVDWSVCHGEVERKGAVRLFWSHPTAQKWPWRGGSSQKYTLLGVFSFLFASLFAALASTSGFSIPFCLFLNLFLTHVCPVLKFHDCDLLVCLRLNSSGPWHSVKLR